jgi:hypothetical protein
MRTDIVVPFCVHAIAVSTVITVVNIRFANCMGKTTLGRKLNVALTIRFSLCSPI